MADKLFKVDTVSTKDIYSSVCSLLDKGWVVKDMKPDAEGGIWVCLTDVDIREYNRSKIEENTTRFRGMRATQG